MTGSGVCEQKGIALDWAKWQAGHANLKQVHVVLHLDFESGGAEDPIQLQLLKAKERGFSFYFHIQGGWPAINEEGAGRGYLCKGLMRAGME